MEPPLTIKAPLATVNPLLAVNKPLVVIVLFVNVSVPAKVANVPVVGSVTSVADVALNI